MARINIDAGHGSNTAGKQHNDGTKEHIGNVMVAVHLEKELKRNGFEVNRTGWNDNNGYDDEDVPITTRQKQIRIAECEVSVSLHENAASNTAADGIETYYYTGHTQSNILAQCIQEKLLEGTSQKNRGVKSNSFAMTNNTALGTKASVLCEVGFMTNDKESSLMKSEAFAIECAEEICKGLCKYFGNKPYIPRDKEECGSGNVYVVNKGDTLSSIARRFGTTYQILAQYNGISTPYTINVGQELVIHCENNTVVETCPYPMPTRTIKRTSPIMTGEDVKFVQWHIGVECDGKFGPASEAALKQWQEANGLDPDGKFGPACRSIC